MTGFGRAEIGDFTFHPCVGILPLDVSADGSDQVMDLPNAPFGRAEVEAHLVGEGGHWGQCTAGGGASLFTWRFGGWREAWFQRSPLLAHRTREKWSTRGWWALQTL